MPWKHIYLCRRACTWCQEHRQLSEISTYHSRENTHLLETGTDIDCNLRSDTELVSTDLYMCNSLWIDVRVLSDAMQVPTGFEIVQKVWDGVPWP